MNKKFIKTLYKANLEASVYLDKQRIEEFVDTVFRFLFQLENKQHHSIQAVQMRLDELRSEFTGILFNVLNNKQEADTIVDQFSEKLPELYDALLKDAQEILDNDPAAQSLEEIYIAYPGFFAIAVYRIAHQLHQQKVNLLPRIWTEYAHGKTGIDIHPGAKIGVPFFIDHGTGIVIGETAIIGSHVKIYQGVTIGAASVSKDKSNTKRHPTLENHVVVYSNATILGGETTIGHHSIIGGNVWLTKSVEPYSLVFHEAQIKIKDKNTTYPEPINFII